jgi:RNA polymerase sigma factor (sigma-70 family)
MTAPKPPGVLDYLTQRYARIKQTLTRRLGNPDLASDALHDTYVRLQGMDEVPEREHPGAYLVRIATNIAVDMQRKDRHTVSNDDIDALLEEFEDPTPGPAQLAEARFDFGVLAREIAAMPEQRRLVVMMVHWEHRSHQEAADALGISRRTVTNELQRAHAHLARTMQGDTK